MREMLSQLESGVSDLVFDDGHKDKTTSATVGKLEQRITTSNVPDAVAQLLGTDAESELVAVARAIGQRNKNKLTLIFHTPIGDVKCPVSWSNVAPIGLARTRSLVLVLVRTSDTTFAPNPGSEVDISFAGTTESKLRVLCVAPPMNLYPGVGIDLLCFLPQITEMEKQGVLKAGAPSAVSGTPSNDFDEVSGEPITTGESMPSVTYGGPPAAIIERQRRIAQLDFDRSRD